MPSQLPMPLHFSRGSLRALAEVVGTAQKLLILLPPHAQQRGWQERLTQFLPARELNWQTISPQPKLQELDQLLITWRSKAPDGLLACGGGSVMDSGKALRWGLAQPPDFRFNNWQKALPKQAAIADRMLLPPLICLPTTAGSGAEVTPFATLWDRDPPRQYCLETQAPSAALIDPELAGALPRELRLSSGLSAVAQAFEAIWSDAVDGHNSAWATRALQLALPAAHPLSA